MPVDRSSSYEEVTGLMKKTKNNTHIPDRMMSADNDGTVDKVKVTPGQQGPCLPLCTRTEVSNMLLVHHQRFMEETTSKSCRETPELTHEMDRHR